MWIKPLIGSMFCFVFLGPGDEESAEEQASTEKTKKPTKPEKRKKVTEKSGKEAKKKRKQVCVQSD